MRNKNPLSTHGEVFVPGCESVGVFFTNKRFQIINLVQHKYSLNRSEIPSKSKKKEHIFFTINPQKIRQAELRLYRFA